LYSERWVRIKFGQEKGEGECVGGEGRSGDLDVGEEGEEEGAPAGGKGQAVV
jgi:hypothetical protein